MFYLLRQHFENLLNELLRATVKVYTDRLISLAVFGSVGRGTPRTDSDVDILLVADNFPPGRIKRVLKFEKVEESIEPFL